MTLDKGVSEMEQGRHGNQHLSVVDDSLDRRVAEEKTLMCQPHVRQKGEQNANNNYSTEEEDEEDDFRPLIIDTSTASDDPPLPPPSQHLFPSFQMDAAPFTVKTEANSMGTLRDYLEGAGVELENNRRRASVSSDCSSVDLKPSSISTSPASTKGSAPSKTRRKSDRILPVPLDDGITQYICPICKDTMDTMTEFTKHIRSHNSTTASISSPNSCTICGKVLSSQSSLDRHMLVHSGERPFKCNLCKMSFTTNGNMHRHMRIHEKEMALAGANPDAKPKTTNKKSRKKDCENRELLAHLNSPPLPPVALKRRIETPVLEPPSPPKKAFIEAPLVMTPIKAEQVEDKIETVSPYVKLLSKSVSKDDSQSECPLCMKTFLCAYGLDTHMQCHGQKSTLIPRCHACNITFRNASLLHEHNLSKHMQAGEKSADPAANAIGFQDLTFLPFSCDKFPVVAKAFCERHQRQSSSSYHGFQCSRCDHAFPCASALKLHREAHAPEFPSTCVLCDVVYGTRQEFYQHMAQHSKQEVVSNFLKLAGTDDNALQDVMTKEEFLLVLDLKVNRDDDQSYNYGEVSAPTSAVKEDLKDNDDYFMKLGLVGSNLQADKPDLAEITKILQLTSNIESMSTLQLKATESDDRQTSEEDEAKNKSEPEGPFTCIYCDEVFTNDRTYKGHVRGHLGLSPYKCNLCTYSSADKSTLIRHLRTHNGERPFQCLVCDFAFTTKANCERHVRKKHAKCTKEEIESSIGYNNFMHEDPTESFASPDTVCKFCGEDFKFFRALKHHLRSHSSCRHKPYACRICGHGFSTKANCIRHVQKQHTHIENNQLEAQIQVNELLLSEEDEAPVEKESHVALRAHLAKKSHFNSSPYISNGTYITSPPVDKRHLEEARRAPQDDAPLDFSRKNSKIDEQPMDLTVKTSPYPLLIPPVYRPLLAKKGEVKVIDKVTATQDGKGSYRTPLSVKLSPAAHDVPPQPSSSAPLLPPSSVTMATNNNHLTFNPNCSIPPYHMISPPPLFDSELAPISNILHTTKGIDIQSIISTPVLPPFQSLMISPDNSLDGSKDEFGSVPRRKRNSYADSPHKLQCPFCQRAFPWISSLKRHIITHTGQKPFKCPECPVTFSTKSNRERHMVRKHSLDIHTPEVKQAMETPFKCQNCPLAVSSAYQLRAHYENVHLEIPPPESLVALIQTEENAPSAEEIFAVLDDLDKNAVVHGNLITFPSLSNRLKQLMPSAEYEDEDEEDDEMLRRTPSPFPFIPRSSSSTSPAFSVPFRSRSTTPSSRCSSTPLSSASSDINPERDNYNVDLIVACWKCGRRCEDRKGLLRHLKEHNVGDLPFKCFLCDASFPQRIDSLRHKMALHSTDWQIIAAKHNIDSVEEFAVQVDLMDSPEANDLEYPQRKVHCTLCPKRFWSVQDLRRHMRSHTGERPFECSVCHARFTLKHSMMRHRRRHEGLASDDDSNLSFPHTTEEAPSFPNFILPKITMP